jgi:AraC-like DNA-binding protein
VTGANPAIAEHAVHTDDLDCVREAVTNAITTHRIDRLDHQCVDARFTEVHIRNLSVMRLAYGTAVRIDADAPKLPFHLIQVPVRGSAVIVSGREEATSTPDIASVPDPRQHCSMRWAPGCDQVIVRIDDQYLQRHLQSLIGRPASDPIRFELAMDLQSSRGQSWRAALDLLMTELQRPGGLMEHPLLASQLESFVLTGLLLAHRHNYSAALLAEQHPAAPRPVKRALERIEEHPEFPLTIEKLANDVGVSVRALQQGFHDLVGCSPMAYLREVRLNRAREALASADPQSGASVTDIALDWGFMHLGRFSVEYRRRFGESPSQTLRR